MPSTPQPLDPYIYMLFLCFGLGGLPLLLSFLTRRKDLLTYLSLSAAVAGALVTIVIAASAWGAPVQSSSFFRFAPLIGLKPGTLLMPDIAFAFYADRLASFFLLLTGVFTLAVTLHMVSWLENLTDRHRIAAVFNLFVLGIVLTILSRTVYSFLVFQECMTLAFAYLALFRHNLYLEKEGVAARDLEGSKLSFKSYLIFEHVGIMLIAIALLLLSASVKGGGADAFDFAFLTKAWVGSGGTGAVLNASLVFLFALAGFGIKAGIFPSHIWVPMVHPYSPTSIHAMMSGIALKVAGLYGMYRVFFFFLAPIQWWWGWLVLLLAGATALFGVFYALLGRDLKTALASHSVENVGIILAGMGLALIFYAEAGADYTHTRLVGYANIQKPYMLGLAGLALIASLYHLVNHSIFKGLLFFCTGAIENRLGVVALDRLGGLMKRYPVTSTAFLIGSVSIAGFPPFNGFVSEWLLLQALFAGMGVYFTRVRVFLLLGLVGVLFCLVLAFSLTALAFVKIAGEALLGAPRDPQVAKNARRGEVRWPMRLVLIVFSALCLLFGMLPGVVTQALSLTAGDMVAGFNENSPVVTAPDLSLHAVMVNPRIFDAKAAENGENTPETVYETRLSNRVLLSLGAILLYAISFSLLVLGSRRAVKTGAPWTCGVPFFDRLMQYTGAAFASLVWKPFELRAMPPSGHDLLPPGHDLPPPGHDLPPLTLAGKPDTLPYREYVTAERYVPEVTRQTYNRLITRLLAACEKIGLAAQPGDIRVYLQYIFVLFIAILVFLLLSQGGR